MEHDIAKYLYELGQLKRVKRSGWWIAGVSVAEHSFRTALIAYILAQLEGADPEKSALMALFHDIPEARVNDLHRVGRRYVSWENVEQRVVEEQAKRLPGEVAERITSLSAELEAAVSAEARVARDADLLECLVQAREYQALGYRDVADWILNAAAGLRSDSAKEIARQCIHTEPKEWWEGLKK